MSDTTVVLPEGFLRRSRAAVEAAMRLCDEAAELRREVQLLNDTAEVICGNEDDAVYNATRGTDFGVLDMLVLHASWLLVGGPDHLWADDAAYLRDRFGWSAPLLPVSACDS